MPLSGSRPVELCSIINVVQHELPKEQDVPSRKLELKSVVCLGNRNTQGSNAVEVKRHDPKSQKVSETSAEKPILLLPFGHQVSGRASIMCFNETTLLKPYVSRELFFYQTIPQDLKIFTPQFRGVVMVSFIEDSRTSSVLAYALPRTLLKPNTKNIFKLIGEEPKPHSKRCVKDYGKTHVIYPTDELDTALNTDEIIEDLFVESSEDFSPVVTNIKKSEDKDDYIVSELSQGFDMQVCIDDKKPSGKENENFSTTGLHNPWNSKVLDDAWLKLKDADAENPSNSKKKRFTLLENVVARYRRPCVLDLKIGTRVRENASPEKIARHVTAINIGARLSGMQIYHPEQENFKYHNKYYGHNLTITGFKSNLRHFFSRGRIPIKGITKQSGSDGKTASLIDKKLVGEAIKKLAELKETIQSIQSHRFYSSSVLLLYEGDISVKESETDPCDRVEDTEKSHEDDQCDYEHDPSSQKKISPRSFSFTDFLQRLKHAKRIHESSSQHHYDLSHDLRRHRASQKFMKGSVIYKIEKNGIKSAHKSHKTGHESKHHHEFGGDVRDTQFQTKSWPPRSKITKRPHSVAIYRDFDKHNKTHDYLSRRHSHRDDHLKERSFRKHHRDIEDCESSQKTQKPKKHSHDKERKSRDHGKLHEKKNDDANTILQKSHGDHEKSHDRKYSQRQHDPSKSRKSHDECSKSLKEKQDDVNDSRQSHDEYPKSPNGSEKKQDLGMGKVSGREDLKRRHCDIPAHHDNLEVKMIDFAHYCFHDDAMHPGPDGGFIFGLENLIKLLGDMLKQS